ncbi:GDSL esterase/lipase At1g74460 [Macadamia integrifolia]|uniref:GDSL esterase/lipase At1g74460 n=1 Tax=Macadamia integrifolia TaxID=60698 RepID=UPI001C4F26C0|nr:GDSL esterase/lipase At1g74460 [Macadamia integrifolia]
MDSAEMRLMGLITILLFLGIATELGSCKVVQFIFGDSLSDVGNNKYLSRSLATANLPWYGIDFGNGLPNGRFTNGRTVADIIGDKTGLPRPPAFMDPSLDEDMILSNGVNYASGGAGILNETGSLFIQRFPFFRQIELFQGTQDLIRNKIGAKEADKFFQESRYVVAMGSNDFINNYLMPTYSDSWTYSDDGFINYLMTTLDQQLKLLHSLGARQLIVFGLAPMGCIPLQRVLGLTGNCQDKTNKLAIKFNDAAAKLIENLSGNLPNASFIFGNAYNVVEDVINNPHKYGFSNSDSPCCSFGRIRPALTCIPASTLCSDRSKYVFWDEYHPSDRANEMMANEIITKLISQTNPPSKAPTHAPAPAHAHAHAPAPAPALSHALAPAPAPLG